MPEEIPGIIAGHSHDGRTCCPECHETLAALAAFLPAMERAVKFLDNPVAKYRDAMKRGKNGRT